MVDCREESLFLGKIFLDLDGDVVVVNVIVGVAIASYQVDPLL